MSYIKTRTILLFVVILQIAPFRVRLFRASLGGRKYAVQVCAWAVTDALPRGARSGWSWNATRHGTNSESGTSRSITKRTGRQALQCTDTLFDEVNETLSGYLRTETARARTSDASYSIFLRLLGKAGLVQRLDDASIEVTLFIVSDLSINSSASDVSGEFGIPFRPRGSEEIDENRVFGVLGRRLPRLFQEPQDALGTLMRHQVIGSILNQCDLSDTTSWTTWAEQAVNISGYRLNSPWAESSSFIEAPQIALQFLPKRATNGIIHVVDRLIIPDFSEFVRASVSPSDQPRASGATESVSPTSASQSALPSNTDTIVRFSEEASPSSSARATGEPTESAEASGGVCFPGSAEAYTAGGGVRMASVVVGTNVVDSVSDGRSVSKIVLFTHRQAPKGRDGAYPFVELRTKEFRIRLSGSHLLPVDGRLLEAGRALVGAWVETVNGSQQIIAKRTVWDGGLYNPQTTSGFLVVDGILASCYTSTLNHATAHALLAPLRMVSRFQLDVTTNWLISLSDFVESCIVESMASCTSNSSIATVTPTTSDDENEQVDLCGIQYGFQNLVVMKMSQTYVVLTKFLGVVVQQATSKMKNG